MLLYNLFGDSIVELSAQLFEVVQVSASNCPFKFEDLETRYKIGSWRRGLRRWNDDGFD